MAGAEESGCKSGAGEIRLVEVPVHDESRFDLQFADCISRQFIALIVGYAECHSWRTAANGPRESVLLFRHQEEIRTASLGQAVDVDEASFWQEVTYLTAQCRAEGLAAAQNPVELDAGGQWLRTGAIERQKFAQHCWHKRRVCDVLLGEHFKDGERFKTRPQP